MQKFIVVIILASTSLWAQLSSGSQASFTEEDERLLEQRILNSQAEIAALIEEADAKTKQIELSLLAESARFLSISDDYNLKIEEEQAQCSFSMDSLDNLLHAKNDAADINLTDLSQKKQGVAERILARIDSLTTKKRAKQDSLALKQAACEGSELTEKEQHRCQKRIDRLLNKIESLSVRISRKEVKLSERVIQLDARIAKVESKKEERVKRLSSSLDELKEGCASEVDALRVKQSDSVERQKGVIAGLQARKLEIESGVIVAVEAIQLSLSDVLE